MAEPELTLATFEPLLNQKFTLSVEGVDDSAEAELVEAKKTEIVGDPESVPREPFSLLFKLPPERTLGQYTYKVENPALGSVSLFLVPWKGDEEGWWMVATFN